MNIKTCLQLAKALNQLSKFDRWNPSTKYMYRRISVLHYYTRTDHQVLFSSLSQYQERVLEAINMELQRSTQAVEEEHNISLKDSSKKFTRNLFTQLLLRRYTQLLLQKQYNRENFFEVQSIPGISFAQT